MPKCWWMHHNSFCTPTALLLHSTFSFLSSYSCSHFLLLYNAISPIILSINLYFFKWKTWRLPFIISGKKHSLLFIFWVRGSQNKGSALSFYYCMYNSPSEVLITFSRRLHEVARLMICVQLPSLHACAQRESTDILTEQKALMKCHFCAWYHTSCYVGRKMAFRQRIGELSTFLFLPPLSSVSDFIAHFVACEKCVTTNSTEIPRIFKAPSVAGGPVQARSDGQETLLTPYTPEGLQPTWIQQWPCPRAFG